jgi:hypothetical protein
MNNKPPEHLQQLVYNYAHEILHSESNPKLKKALRRNYKTGISNMMRNLNSQCMGYNQFIRLCEILELNPKLHIEINQTS